MENFEIEQKIINRVKNKLDCDWEDKVFYKRVFEELELSGFKNLSFLSDILNDWDTSHLTGYPAIIAQAGLSLNRNTDELDFYKDLFSQLGKDKLVHFLAWCVAGKELDESVIDKIVPQYTDDEIKRIVESWGAKITENVDDCPKCYRQPGLPSGKRQACFSCAKKSIQSKERVHIPR